MYYLGLLQDHNEALEKIINQQTAIEKIELFSRLSHIIVDEEVQIENLIKGDEEISEIINAAKRIAAIDEFKDYLELLHIEKMNKGYKVMKDMKERGFVFK